MLFTGHVESFMIGRNFTLTVDNKPIMSIVHPERKIPILSATRLFSSKKLLLLDE